MRMEKKMYRLLLSALLVIGVAPAQRTNPEPAIAGKAYQSERPLAAYLMDLSAVTGQLISYEDAAWDSASVPNPARLSANSGRWMGPAMRRVVLPDPVSAALSKRPAAEMLPSVLAAYGQQAGEFFDAEVSQSLVRVIARGRPQSRPLDVEVEMPEAQASPLQTIQALMKVVSSATGVEMVVDDGAFGYRFDSAFGEDPARAAPAGRTIARDLLQSLLAQSRTSTTWFVACEANGEARRCIVNLAPLFVDVESEDGRKVRRPVFQDRMR